MLRAALLLLVLPVALQASGPEVLRRRCLNCHGAQTRMGGLSLEIRVDAEISLARKLRERVESGTMPPGGGLSPGERQEVLAWLNDGAVWPGRLTPVARSRADKNWWSLQPLRAGGESIDTFVVAGLSEKGLTLSPPADRRTMIRRLTFDLTGLPPTPEEVTSFLADPAPDAYERLVDRLLASPAYGERWARHWMDVVRYGDSHGYEQNHLRPNAWPFRDYLIRAFNSDTPYDQMIAEHLAGDVLGNGDPKIEAATGFLVAGPHDTVGNQAEAFKRQQRADDYDDIVNATASAFLGLTVSCAKCHDHKFDPIRQTDYYRLASVFAGVFHGERDLATPAEREAHAQAVAPFDKRMETAAAIRKQLKEKAAPGLAEAEERVRARHRAPVSPFLGGEEFSPVTASAVRVRMPAGAPGGLDEIEVLTTDAKNAALGARVDASSTRVAEGNPDAYHPRFLTDGSFNKRWFAAVGKDVTVTISWDKPVPVGAVRWSTDRLKAFQGRFQQGTIAEYAIDLRDASGAWREVASSAGRLPARPAEQERLFLLEALNEKDRSTYLAAEADSAAAEAERKKIPALPRAYAGIFKKPEEPVYLLSGGNVMRRGDPMPAGSPSALPGFELELDAPESERRLALAKWLGDPKNPLTPRVMANRLWHYHFGTGIVATPSDFGFNGERPSHPELLDYLAGRLLHYGWRLKPLHREIVLSAAYRQSSAWRPKAGQIDAGSRLLWRYPPRRLEGEAIRDNMLAVAGLLKPDPGGPGFALFQYTVDNVATYFPLETQGPETYRRGVYALSARSIRNELLSVNDCPDSSLPEPRRVVTTSPLQSLSLLNHSFTLDMAKAFARRVSSESDPVGLAFRLAYGRGPTESERAGADQLIGKHGAEAFTRAIFNTNEFVYVH